MPQSCAGREDEVEDSDRPGVSGDRPRCAAAIAPAVSQGLGSRVLEEHLEACDDTNDLLVPFIQERNAGIAREVINQVYVQASLGQITSRRFWDQVGLGRQYPEVETAYLDTRLTIDAEFPPVARRLSGRFSLGLLSSDLSEWSAYLRAKYSMAFLDAVTISGDVGCRKPAPEIYERFLRDAGAQAPECAFLDDRCKNLSAAAALGMRTIRFERQPDESGFVPDASIESFGQLEHAISIIQQEHTRA
jgi:putative hydrolase of the HAD superfamily